MKMKWVLMCSCVFIAACGGDDPIVIEDIAEEPGRKDVAMLCDLYVQRLSGKTDKAAEAGFSEMARLGISEKGIEKARESRKEGREAYVDGIEACCEAFNDEVKELEDTQVAFVYSDLVLSGITRDMMTPAMQRAARALRDASNDNMTRPESRAAYDVRQSLPRCEKKVSMRVSKASQDVMRAIMKDYRQ